MGRALLVACAVGALTLPVAANEAGEEDLLDGVRGVELEYEMGARSLEMYLERTRRLKRISDRIRLEGAALCGDQLAPVWGMVVTTASELPSAFYYPALHRFRIDDRVRVVWVMPDLPADRAGLREGDVITRINGERLGDAAELREYRPGPDETGPIVLRVLRDDWPLDLEVENRPGCFSPADLAFGDTVNAFADGHQIIVFSGLMRLLVEDDALAIVIGHELAHNVLGHVGSGGHQLQEPEADYMGAYFAARAGYDVSAAQDVWRRFAEQSVYSVATRATRSHPSAPRRILALRQALAEIEAKRAAGLPLEPEMLP